MLGGFHGQGVHRETVT